MITQQDQMIGKKFVKYVFKKQILWKWIIQVFNSPITFGERESYLNCPKANT